MWDLWLLFTPREDLDEVRAAIEFATYLGIGRRVRAALNINARGGCMDGHAIAAIGICVK